MSTPPTRTVRKGIALALAVPIAAVALLGCGGSSPEAPATTAKLKKWWGSPQVSPVREPDYVSRPEYDGAKPVESPSMPRPPALTYSAPPGASEEE